MKVIIAGSTGLVGSAVVRECIANDKITHVFALTRKPLPEAVSSNPKVTVVTHDDFSVYPPELLARLAGAGECIWAIGGRAMDFSDVETYKKVQNDYTIAAARAFLDHLAPQLPDDGQKDFRFVFCSGKFAEWDQKKALHFLADTRRVKGQVEQGLCELADRSEGCLVVHCGRPSAILPADAALPIRLGGKLIGGIEVDRLAKAFVRILLEGYPERIVEHAGLMELGRV